MPRLRAARDTGVLLRDDAATGSGNAPRSRRSRRGSRRRRPPPRGRGRSARARMRSPRRASPAASKAGITTETLTRPASRTARGNRATSCLVRAGAFDLPASRQPPRELRGRRAPAAAPRRARRGSSGTRSSAFSPSTTQLAQAAHGRSRRAACPRRAPRGDQRQALPARGEHDRVGGAHQRPGVRPHAQEADAVGDAELARPARSSSAAAARRRRSRAARRGTAAIARIARRVVLRLDEPARRRGRVAYPGSSPSAARSAGGGAGANGVRDRRERRSAPCSLERRRDARAAGDAGRARRAGAPRTVAGPVLLGDAVDADEPGRPPAAERGEAGDEGHGRVVRVHDVAAAVCGSLGGRRARRAGMRHGRRWTSGSGKGSAVELARRAAPGAAATKTSCPAAARPGTSRRVPARPRRCRAPGSRGGCAQSLVERDASPRRRRRARSARAAARAPLRAELARRSGSPASCSRASASARGLSGSTSSPVSPSTTSSGIPPTRVADDGQAGRHRLEDRERQVVGARGLDEHVELRRAARARRRRSRGSARRRRPLAPAARAPREASRRRRARAAAAPRPAARPRAGRRSPSSTRGSRRLRRRARRDRRAVRAAPESTPSGITWRSRGEKPWASRKSAIACEGATTCPSRAKPGLDRQVAVLEPGEPALARRPAGRGRPGGRSALRSPPASHAGYEAPGLRGAGRPAARTGPHAGRGCGRGRLPPAVARGRRRRAQSSLWPTGTASAPTPSPRKLSATASLAQSTWTSIPAAATRGASCFRCVTGRRARSWRRRRRSSLFGFAPSARRPRSPRRGRRSARRAGSTAPRGTSSLRSRSSARCVRCGRSPASP